MSSEEFVNDQRINFISKKKKRNIGRFSLLAAALLAIVIVVPIFSSINNPKSDNSSKHIDEKMYSNSIELSNSLDESKTENINDKMANDEEYSRITSNINLEEIKRIAIGELGMTYATEGQVIPYESNSNDYMRQADNSQN